MASDHAAIIAIGKAMADDLVSAARASADRLGIDPSDLLTAISYETGGRMSPSLYGGKDGKYLGLIQFSPDNQRKYSVTPRQTAPEQMQAVESYLRDRGVKPGHGLLDIYSTINAGRPGLYDRSDAANGGAPGTVADKVATMAGHRIRANSMLGVNGAPQVAAPAQPGASPAPATATATASAVGAPLSLAPSAGAGDAPAGAPGDDQLAAMLRGLAAIPAGVQQDRGIEPMPFEPIHYFKPKQVVRQQA